MKIFNLNQIQNCINLSSNLDSIIESQKTAFMDFSQGLYDTPSPMQFILDRRGYDCHIKGAYKNGSDDLVIKVAGSGIDGNNGAIFIFDANTFEIKAILNDRGFLTTLRTAIAGIIAIEILPWNPINIGIIGSGALAKQLYDLIRQKHPTANIMIYARNQTRAAKICDKLCHSVDDMMSQCDIIFTATSSLDPIICAIPNDQNIAIIALGSDDERKSEIATILFKDVDSVIVDSVQQATKFGDIAKALQADFIPPNNLIELGTALKRGTQKHSRSFIFDFSGIGAQDYAITSYLNSLQHS